MNFSNVATEPAILIITSFFLFFIFTIIKNYTKTEKNLRSVYNFLSSLNKKEISYRFNDLNDFMSNNEYTKTCWEDFKKALIFPEKIYVASQENNQNNNNDIYLSIDAAYFFNEDSLVYSKINHKFIQAMPTLLTGLGPFFTFLKMAIAFTSVNFSFNAAEGTLNDLIANIQIAALCSVFAVGYSLLFMFIEKILYNTKCKKYYLLIQKEFIRLFDICTSEQFLLDLIKESKLQNINNEKILKKLYDSNMEIGNHTYSHLLLTKYKEDKIQEEINNTNKLVYEITKNYPTLLRPSYGAVNKRIRENSNMPIILWNIDTLDWKYKNSNKIAKRVLDNVKDGDIILMHDIHKSTLNSLDIIIPELLSKGYQIVSVSELFYYKEIDLEKGKVYGFAK